MKARQSGYSMGMVFRFAQVRIGFWGYVVLLFGALGSAQPEIEFWYGERQRFGMLGAPQKQVNILGNICGYSDMPRAWFTLNDDPAEYPLTLGSDQHRLARDGDFNVEIDRGELRGGNNIVTVVAEGVDGLRVEKSVTIEYHSGGRWPLPYRVNWDRVSKIQDVVEIVDGEWRKTSEGVRTSSPYYDRILALGDVSWKDYEVGTSVKFHGFTEPAPGPPTYNVAHVAIAVRWPGHDQDDLQPHRKWYPLGATAEFRIETDYQNCRWRIFDGEIFYAEQGPAVRDPIEPETWYGMKHRVESLSPTRTLYSVKFWPSDESEPKEWDFQAIEISEVQELGSVCIIAHNTDVTFGNVTVTPVK